MELTQTSEQQTETLTQEAQTEINPETQETETTDQQAQAAEGVETPEVPAYEPNFKYTAAGEEHEFDEWVKPFISDKEKEKAFRDLYSRATGMKSIKSERDEMKTRFEQANQYVEQNLMPVVQNFQNLNQLRSQGLKTGDFANFFMAADIPVDQVVRWAANYVARLEQNPHYAHQMKAEYDTNTRLQTLEAQNRQLMESSNNTLREAKMYELSTALSQPGIVEFAKTYDEANGKGAFQSAVVFQGNMIWQNQGRNAPAMEVAQQVMKMFGGTQAFSNPTTSAGGIPVTTDTTPVGQTGAVNGAGGKPVIPNIKGRGTSPTTKAISSVEDLRKRARELTAS